MKIKWIIIIGIIVIIATFIIINKDSTITKIFPKSVDAISSRAEGEAFTIDEYTEYGIDKNILYLNITENLGVNHQVNILNTFDNNALTNSIVFKEIYYKKDVTKDTYNIKNISIGTYKRYTETTNGSFTMRTYEDNQGNILCKSILDPNERFLTCSYVLANKSVYQPKEIANGTITIKEWTLIPDRIVQKVNSGLTIENKFSSVTLPANSKYEFKLIYTHPFLTIENKPNERQNKYNITISSTDGTYSTILDPIWFDSLWLGCKNITITESSGITRLNEITNINVTGLTMSNLNEVRIVNAPCNQGGSEVGYYLVNGSASLSAGSDWIDVAFQGNYTASTTTNYSIYYNNIETGNSTINSNINYFNSFEYGTGLHGFTIVGTPTLNTSQKYYGNQAIYLDSTDAFTLSFTAPSYPFNITLWARHSSELSSTNTYHIIRTQVGTSTEWFALSYNDDTFGTGNDRYATLEDGAIWGYYAYALKNNWAENTMEIISNTKALIYVNESFIDIDTLNPGIVNKLLFSSTGTGGWNADFIIIGSNYNTYYTPVNYLIGNEETKSNPSLIIITPTNTSIVKVSSGGTMNISYTINSTEIINITNISLGSYNCSTVYFCNGNPTDCLLFTNSSSCSFSGCNWNQGYIRGFLEDFESNSISNWSISNFNIVTDQKIGSYSAKCVSGTTCNMNITNSYYINSTGSTYINVTFWEREDDIDLNDAKIYWLNSTGSWITIHDLNRVTTGEDIWVGITNISTDPQFLHDNFSIRFSSIMGSGENLWIDNITIYTSQSDSSTSCSGTENICGTYSTSGECSNNTGCSWGDEFYMGSGIWTSNITLPVGIPNGLYNLFVNINRTSSNILYNSTNLNAVNYSVGGEPPADTCTWTSGNWAISLADYCIINTNTDLHPNNISFTNSGNVTFNATIDLCDLGDPPSNERLWLGSNGKINVGKCT